MTDRRTFLAAGLSAATILSSCNKTGTPPPQSRPRKNPTIVLRSGWQTVNIGDIAHTPGALRLIEQHIPEARVILWSNALDRGVDKLLAKNFPRVRIVSGEAGPDAQPDTEGLREAFHTADLLIHGSAAGIQRKHLAAWRAHTGKPYGILGVTVALTDEAVSKGIDDELRGLLDGAAFVFTRETASLANLRQAGIRSPRQRFVPDGTFNAKLADEETAKAFLAKNRLEPKKFIAIVPRLRYTPYHTFRKVDWPPEEVRRRVEVNDKHKEPDHAKLREVVTTWVRRTGLRALLCPEMTYALDILDPLLYNALPADVKAKVARRKTFWLTDEAASVYRRAVAVISMECHSPILAATVDTPCIYVHQPEDGIKGQMWKDIGLGSWYFEVEESTGAQIAERLMKIHAAYDAAQVDVHEAALYARKLQTDGMAEIRKFILES